MAWSSSESETEHQKGKKKKKKSDTVKSEELESILGFPGGSAVKNPPVMQEMWVWSLGWEDPLEKEMATLSNILAWKIPWTEEPGGLQSMESQKSWTRPSKSNFHSLLYI